MKKNNTLRLIGIAVAFCLLAFAQNLSAQATLSIQGIIQKSNGAAVDDGKYDLTFKLYTVASGGTAVHTETQNIAVAGGIYSAELGSGPTPLTAAFDQTYYLGVAVDGGAELIPRARLTSSPYALALLGTANLFPSSGPIGAGTITPTSGYQMHIRSADAAGKLLLEGSTAAQIDFKKGSTVGAVGFGTSSSDFVINPGSNNTNLQFNGSTKLAVTTDGIRVPGIYNPASGGNLGLFVDGTERIRAYSAGATIYGNGVATSKFAVGQAGVDANNVLKVEGTSFFNGFAEFSGSKNQGFGGGRFFNAGGCSYDHLCPFGGGSWDFGMRVNNRLAAGEFWAFSDRRIKRDISLSEGKSDLGTLRQLRVSNYRHIDVVEKGGSFKKGFIAQEVREVFPEAVTESANFIPNVYEIAANIQHKGNKLTITTGKKHEFAIGDEVKIILEAGERKAIVNGVPSENAFTITWDEEASPEKVFVFGKKVHDFQTVDYDRVFTLNVSATQELARQVEELKKENAALRSELGSTKAENKELKASVDKFDARLRALENRHSN